MGTKKRNEWGAGWLVEPGVHGRYYVACWKFGGKTFRKSTKTKDKKVAEKLLKEFVAPYQSARDGRHAEAVAEAVAAGKEQQKRHLDRLPALKVTDAFSVYEKVVGKTLSARTILGNRFKCGAFVEWLKENRRDGAALEMRDVGLATVEDYLKFKALHGIAPQTRAQIAMAIKSVWSRIAEAEAKREADKTVVDRTTFAGFPWSRLNSLDGASQWWTRDVCASCRPQDGEKIEAQTKGRKSLDRDEMHRLLDAAKPGEKRLLFRIGAQTGLRMGDCARLKFGENVRLDEGRTGRLIVIPEKTGRRSSAYVDTALGRELHDYLSALPQAKTDGAYLMPVLADRYNRDPGLVSTVVRAVFKKAGFETAVEVVKGKRRRAEYGFHSLRYSLARVMASAGLEVAASSLGHSNTATTRSYLNGAKNEDDREREAEAWKAWFDGTSQKSSKTPASAFAVRAGEVGRADVTDAQKPVFDAVCAMLGNLEPETLRAVASEALKLAMANAIKAGAKAVAS